MSGEQEFYSDIQSHARAVLDRYGVKMFRAKVASVASDGSITLQRERNKRADGSWPADAATSVRLDPSQKIIVGDYVWCLSQSGHSFVLGRVSKPADESVQDVRNRADDAYDRTSNISSGQLKDREVARIKVAVNAIGSAELADKSVLDRHIDNVQFGKINGTPERWEPRGHGSEAHVSGMKAQPTNHGNEAHDPTFAPKKHNHQKSIAFHSMVDNARAAMIQARQTVRNVRDDTGAMTQDQKIDALTTGLLHLMHATYDSPNSTAEQIHAAIINGDTTREFFAESQYQDAPDFTTSYHWNNPGIDVEGGSSPGEHPINVKVSNIQHTIADLSPYTIEEVS